MPPRDLKGLTFRGLYHPDHAPVYPKWMYQDGFDPLKVESTDEEKQAKLEGWDIISPQQTANRHLINWAWDLEDMSPRQLIVFAREEFDIELPIEAGQDKLFKAVTELTKFAPQNRNRLVLMAHTISMEYDATQDEIRRMIAGEGRDLEHETETFEVYL